MRNNLLRVFVFSISFSSLAVDFFPEDTQGHAKIIMNEVYDSYVKIIPFVYSPEKVLRVSTDVKEKNELLVNLTNLSKSFKDSKHNEFLKRPGLKESLDTINSHLKDTIQYVSSGNFVFAQKRLNEIGSLCISCHTQLPKSIAKKSFGENIFKEKRGVFDSDYSYANYLYLVRNYKDSRKYFEKVIENDLNNSDKTLNRKVIASLRKIVSIDTKVSFNYKKANIILSKWNADKRLSSIERNIIGKWIEDLAKWKTDSSPLASNVSDIIEKYLNPLNSHNEKILNGEKDITLLVTSGFLSKYLIDNPKTQKAPEILYWLSFAEYRMSQSYFFSLGDTYLKDCIRKYPLSPFARKCFDEYSKNIEVGYSGSSGTNIPLEDRRELIELEKLITHKK